jgi:hypothetical protein
MSPASARPFSFGVADFDLALGFSAFATLPAFFAALPIAALPLGAVPLVPFPVAVPAGVATCAAVFGGVALVVAGLAGAAASACAASLSAVTAVSRAFVAVVIAVSALVSVFAEVAARVAAALSLVEADVTFVAAVATVRVVAGVARAFVTRTELAIRTGAAFLSSAFFVGGTDLPPIWIR